MLNDLADKPDELDCFRTYCFSPFLVQRKNIVFAPAIVAHFRDAPTMGKHAAIWTKGSKKKYLYLFRHTSTLVDMTRPNEAATVITENRFEREWLLVEMISYVDFQLMKDTRRIEGATSRKEELTSGYFFPLHGPANRL